ncbi:uncharacterized protein LOC122084222 [Macadamia integrifolia]|uniref:uncharacterized protein LOC122084222 n=1 Tax=Macadamia integrifolia TaxID=60698 RepID=UPI001C4EC4B2|nr:uncharacterized protein LOC122084222 [Macadamia integrifolia]
MMKKLAWSIVVTFLFHLLAPVGSLVLLPCQPMGCPEQLYANSTCLYIMNQPAGRQLLSGGEMLEHQGFAKGNITLVPLSHPGFCFVDIESRSFLEVSCASYDSFRVTLYEEKLWFLRKRGLTQKEKEEFLGRLQGHACWEVSAPQQTTVGQS